MRSPNKAIPLFIVFLACLFSGCTAIKPVPLTPFADGTYSATSRTIRYESPKTKKTYVVPAGFVTDFASVPRAAWPVLPPTGSYQWAALVHDYLYWEQTVPRAEADAVILEAMEASKVPYVTRNTIYQAVSNFGGFAWRENHKLKSAGMIKSIQKPDGSLYEIAANTTWPQLRANILKNHSLPSSPKLSRIAIGMRKSAVITELGEPERGIDGDVWLYSQAGVVRFSAGFVSSIEAE